MRHESVTKQVVFLKAHMDHSDASIKELKKEEHETGAWRGGYLNEDMYYLSRRKSR